MLLREVPTFARVQILDFGSLEETASDSFFIDDVAAIWTRGENASNIFSTVEVRGLIDHHAGLSWLPGDATVRVVEGPKYAGQPEDLVLEARPVEAPAGSQGGGMVTPEGWPDLIWRSDIVFSPVQGWSDPELSVEVLLCALAVAPDNDPLLRPMLLAALKARYAKVLRTPRTYPPSQYPWRGRAAPGADMIEYLTD